METCLGLGRSKCNLNKQQHKDLKLQDQQQQQHTLLQKQKQQTLATITKQNYYTTQQQPQNQRHLLPRGLTANVGVLKPGLQQQQQQHNEESHLLRQEKHQNVQHSATPCTTPQYQNTGATTTTANMQQLSLSAAKDSAGGVDSAVQQHLQPQTITFQSNMVTAEVTPTLPSTVSPANTPGIVTIENVKTFRKINRKIQQQQQQQHKFQQKHQHQHLLHQQQQLEADLDAIEVCADPEPHISIKGVGGMLRQNETLLTSSALMRLHHQHQHHHSIEDHHDQGTHITSLQLLQLQQQQQHDYSYAYYEPGVAMRHTNIPHAELMADANEGEDLIPPPPNSIRALLLKGKKNKLLVSPTTRESYQLRLTEKESYNGAGATDSANCSNISTPENVYEEISGSSTSSSSNSMASPQQLRVTSHSAGSLTRTLVEEELRRVQNRHYKILGELNLSVEAMLMPESPPSSSPTTKEPPMPVVSVTTSSGQPLRLTSSSADNICDTALTYGTADDFISPLPNSATVRVGLLQSSCLATDLDSGFSGSSGASYIGSLRLHKTNALKSSRSNNLSSTTTAAAGNNAAAKSQQSAFAYATQCCRSFQRANSYKGNATATSASASSSSTALKASATTSSCTIKHLPQIRHNTKHQQHHHHSHLNNHHLHQQQQHQKSQHINEGLQNSSGFFTRASCGCRILNCAKIRAARNPDPVALNAQPKESKARSFWNRKGWRKLPGFSTSTSNINDPG